MGCISSGCVEVNIEGALLTKESGPVNWECYGPGWSIQSIGIMTVGVGVGVCIR